jgi:hypothetical protein
MAARAAVPGNYYSVDLFLARNGVGAVSLAELRSLCKRNNVQSQAFSDREETIMSESLFESLLGKATVGVWGDLPRDLQEAIFELAARNAPEMRSDLAAYLHNHHPKTYHAQGPA